MRDAVDDRREQVLVDLLHREAALRKSKKVQDDMESAEESAETEWMSVIDVLQRQIVNEYLSTLSDQGTGISVTDLRIAALRHPEIAFWVKHNRARQGELRVGDKAPDSPLRRATDGTETSLLKQKREQADSSPTKKPLVVFAGSLS